MLRSRVPSSRVSTEARGIPTSDRPPAADTNSCWAGHVLSRCIWHMTVCAFAFNCVVGVGRSIGAQDNSPSTPNGPDTQVETVRPLTDREAIEAWSLPEGFEMGLYASSPEIYQPIAGTFDRRGRFWLVENFSYAELPQRFAREYSDRVVILSDQDHDGHAESREVFCDDMKLLSSVEVGLGGVWLLGAPCLWFVPDAELDGVPDGPAIAVLDGFDDDSVGHNVVNGLKWGPDGWLYGRHGIQATSHVGTPGTPAEKRISLNCCIWRYHPYHQKFEVVCEGTTNPWGHDWDRHGELFFINTVIGHLWHAIPGLHMERMYGEDLRPNRFHLTAQVADHYHWDRRHEAWMQQRDGMTPGTDEAGGGHAHSGLLIYSGYRWPNAFHGDVLTLNFHGRRVNRDRIETLGATYTATHQPDPFKTSDSWFRGIDLMCGPDDAVYILDWSDLGECHENDGIHRSSGRVYRLDYTAPPAPSSIVRAPRLWQDVADILEDGNWDQLAELLGDDRPWVWRQARLRLQERTLGLAIADDQKAAELGPIRDNLWNRFQATRNSSLRYQYFQGLAAIDGWNDAELLTLLGHTDRHIRVAAIRLLTDRSMVGTTSNIGPMPAQTVSPSSDPTQAASTSTGDNADATESATIPTLGRLPLASYSGLQPASLSTAIASRLIEHASKETDGLVLTYLASAMRHMDHESRWQMALRLAVHHEYKEDRVYPYLIWYGLEPAVASHHANIGDFLTANQIPILDSFVGRRLAIEYTYRPEVLDALISWVTQHSPPTTRTNDIVAGLNAGWEGWTALPAPRGWNAWAATLKAKGDSRLQTGLDEIEAVFSLTQSIKEQIALLSDESKSLAARKTVIRSVVRQMNDMWKSESAASVPDDVLEGARFLAQLTQHRFLGAEAATQLGRWNDPLAADLLLDSMATANVEARNAIVAILCQRVDSAAKLLSQVRSGAVPRDAISAAQIRQIQWLADPTLDPLVDALWPELAADIDASKRERLTRWQTLFSEERIAAGNHEIGRRLFRQQCGQCHRLLDEGRSLGPELTGGQRSNLMFWLHNLVAPSAEVSTEFRLSVILMNDGRSLSGVVTRRTPVSFVLLNQEGQELIRLDEVDEIRELPQSLMPEGLLEALNDEDKVHLMSFLMFGQN